MITMFKTATDYCAAATACDLKTSQIINLPQSAAVYFT